MRSRRITLTQAAGRLEELQELLVRKGYEVVRRPLLETVPRLDPDTRLAAEALQDLPWLLFTSRSSVDALLALGHDLRGGRLGAVGPATAGALEAAGGEVTVVAVPSDAEGLAHAFLDHPQACGPVGLPRGNRALDTLDRLLNEAGVETRPVVVYDTVRREWDDAGAETEAGLIILASPSAVKALPEPVGRRARLVTLGPRTSLAARARGWSCEEAARPTAEEALVAVERLLA